MARRTFLPGIAMLWCIWSVAPAAPQQYEYPFQNPNLTVEERAASILSLMTLDEKIAALTDPAVARLKIPGYGTSEAIHRWC